MGPLGILDCIFFIIILIFAVAAAVKGFIREVLGKASWVLAVVSSILFYAKAGALFPESIKGETLRNILGFVCVFLGVFLVVKLIEVLLSKIFSGEVVGGLNKALGFLFGLAEGFVFVFAVLFLMHVQPWIDMSGITKDSGINQFYEEKIMPEVGLSPDISFTGEEA